MRVEEREKMYRSFFSFPDSSSTCLPHRLEGAVPNIAGHFLPLSQLIRQVLDTWAQQAGENLCQEFELEMSGGCSCVEVQVLFRYRAGTWFAGRKMRPRGKSRWTPGRKDGCVCLSPWAGLSLHIVSSAPGVYAEHHPPPALPRHLSKLLEQVLSHWIKFSLRKKVQEKEAHSSWAFHQTHCWWHPYFWDEERKCFAGYIIYIGIHGMRMFCSFLIFKNFDLCFI